MAEFAGYGRTLVAFSGGVDSSVVLAACRPRAGRRRRGGRHGGLAGRAGRRDRGGSGVLRRAGSDAPHAAHRRAGRGRIPRERPGPLLLLQEHAARHRPRGRRRARLRRRGDRHQRLRRRGRFPARHPGGGRARRAHAAGRRRAGQGRGPRRRAPLGTVHLGQAGGRLPVQPDRVRHRHHAAPAGPRRARRGGRPQAARRPAICGSATSATPFGSRSTPTWSPRPRPTPRCTRRSPRPGSTAPS